MNRLLLLVVGLFAFNFSLRADEDFAAKKAEMSKRIEERIAQMQEHKACVDQANDKDALKACHEKIREHMKEHHAEMKEKRKERHEKHKKH